ncbi:sensor histidine kinase [uncultured Roseibium sp.]|uniref:sensor histidine kinase n=1 Tax=uncultured Roseibium sp. TaxID=1936171 RepID=UPI003217A7D9
MKKTASLRTRLIVIILVPLLLIATAVGFWQLRKARDRATDLFDRALLSAALAVASDVDAQDGDAISIPTRELLSDTSGGPVFYHVYAPDGAFVTGYATPPLPVGNKPIPEGPIVYYNGHYKGNLVRILRMKDVAQISGSTGTFTFTVWQSLDIRLNFVREVTTQSFLALGALLGTVAFVVWFGVKLGLRPLLDLEAAIALRGTNDLSPIRRPVPEEAQGLVKTLNDLFAQVSTSMEAQKVFVSNAAHQLRNPIAGVLAMAEAVKNAPNELAARKRAEELLFEARQASELANKLLTLERVQSVHDGQQSVFDLTRAVRLAIEKHRRQAANAGIALCSDVPDHPIEILGDEVMVQEAVANLIDNSLLHGGDDLKQIMVSLSRSGPTAEITVRDDGIGVELADHQKILDRFGQAKPGKGSGLGLSITQAVARKHAGELIIDSANPGLVIKMYFTLHTAATPAA